MTAEVEDLKRKLEEMTRSFPPEGLYMTRTKAGCEESSVPLRVVGMMVRVEEGEEFSMDDGHPDPALADYEGRDERGYYDAGDVVLDVRIALPDGSILTPAHGLPPEVVRRVNSWDEMAIQTIQEMEENLRLAFTTLNKEGLSRSGLGVSDAIQMAKRGEEGGLPEISEKEILEGYGLELDW